MIETGIKDHSREVNFALRTRCQAAKASMTRLKNLGGKKLTYVNIRKAEIADLTGPAHTPELTDTAVSFSPLAGEYEARRYRFQPGL